MRREEPTARSSNLRERALRTVVDMVQALVRVVYGCVILALAFSSGCSADRSPIAPQSPEATLIVSGTVEDRLSHAPVGNSMVLFKGPVSASVQATAQGSYELRGLVPGEYDVTISGPSHVQHDTLRLLLAESTKISFSVVTWGAQHTGAAYDPTFQQFFHQLARVGAGTGILRKWILKPTELYLIQGTVPPEQFQVVQAELESLNQEIIPALWCNWTGPLALRTGPDEPPDTDGRIVVRPNWEDGASGTVGQTQVRTGRVAVNVFGPTHDRLLTSQEIRGVLAHELFHVAGAFHVCGGNLGENPFGFSPTNCPYPDSLMANRGDLPVAPSAEDRLASCLIYSSDTVPGNRYPDINPYYARR